MKCRFEHDGDCCNSGATQYMCKCKQPCDTIFPMTNADHFREAISTEDGLAKFLMKVHDDEIYIPFCQNKEECLDLIEENGVLEEKCMECMKEWLRKPYEGDCV